MLNVIKMQTHIETVLIKQIFFYLFWILNMNLVWCIFGLVCLMSPNLRQDGFTGLIP